jgi:D-beta-D-heptose 7-phosphate kinase/D-beta-D-heptose 1-phosphate adenosyltransferase
LLSLLTRFKDVRVAVVGDLMLDRYIWGKASRISQEAPVPVVLVQRETQVPGGAANVVRNITSLEGQAVAFGAIGRDPHGETLRRLLREGGADVDQIQVSDRRPTTLKTRVLAGNQQVVRIDQEDTTLFSDELLDKLRRGLADMLKKDQIGAIIFEDYAKGLLSREFMQEIVDLAHRHGKFCALDPHPSNPFKVRGLRLMTPNRAEAFGLAGLYYKPTVLPLKNDLALQEVGRRLQQDWDVELLLITMGADGMALFQPDLPPVHIPTRAQEVFDVSGAGDTVTASFVLSLLAGATPTEAAELANHAAGIVVGKVGTVPVPKEELIRELQGTNE